VSSHHHRILLSQHERLRVLLATVRRAAASVLSHGEPLTPGLAHLFDRAIEGLAAELDLHLVSENVMLGAALMRGPSGLKHLDALQSEHDHERDLFEKLRPQRSQLATYERARTAMTVVDEIIRHLEAEERDVYPSAFGPVDPSPA
jgi:iron-sulfur cluster repair protein YtfE (RIC family)